VQVGGEVPLVLGLSLNTQTARFPAIVPGISEVYVATVAATVTSTAGNATLSVVDSSQTPNGRLTNGTASLQQPLRVRANNAANPSTITAPLTATPTALLTYTTYVSNDPVTITVTQAIGAAEPLLFGAYSKTMTFTLSTVTP
jgi:hypothetical protein